METPDAPAQVSVMDAVELVVTARSAMAAHAALGAATSIPGLAASFDARSRWASTAPVPASAGASGSELDEQAEAATRHGTAIESHELRSESM
jgi:hypothetical protein